MCSQGLFVTYRVTFLVFPFKFLIAFFYQIFQQFLNMFISLYTQQIEVPVIFDMFERERNNLLMIRKSRQHNCTRCFVCHGAIFFSSLCIQLCRLQFHSVYIFKSVIHSKDVSFILCHF